MAKTATKASNDEATTPADEIELTRYELMTLVTPDASTTEYAKHVDTVKKLLADHGASIWHEEDWGKRELAYAIKKQDYAYYLILNFDMDPAQMPKVEEQLRIMNFVLRHLVLKVPENYTPQTYDLDFEEDRSAKAEEVKKPAPKKKVAPVKKEAKPAPVEEIEKTPEEVIKEEAAPEIKEDDVKEPVVEETAEEVAEVAPEAPAEPVVDVKSDKESKADLSKLDAKLEELLSGDDDLNL